VHVRYVKICMYVSEIKYVLYVWIQVCVRWSAVAVPQVHFLECALTKPWEGLENRQFEQKSKVVIVVSSSVELLMLKCGWTDRWRTFVLKVPSTCGKSHRKYSFCPLHWLWKCTLKYDFLPLFFAPHHLFICTCDCLFVVIIHNSES